MPQKRRLVNQFVAGNFLAAPPHVPKFPPHASTATARSVVSASAAPGELERIVHGTAVCAERTAFPAVRLADRVPGAADLAQRPARRTSTQSTSRTTSCAQGLTKTVETLHLKAYGDIRPALARAQEIIDKGDPHLIRSSAIDRDRWQYERPEPDHERER